jgi:phospholipid/cholesterol/gamma-HCH transport system substrate-binding protein
VASSFRNAGGVERALDTVFYLTSSENGYDSLSHYLRAGLVVNLCSSYFSKPSPGCFSFFDKSTQTTATAARASGGAHTHKRRARTPALVAQAAARTGAQQSDENAQLLDFLLGDGSAR